MGWTQGHEGRTPEGEESWGIRPCFRKVLRLRAIAPPTPASPKTLLHLGTGWDPSKGSWDVP